MQPSLPDSNRVIYVVLLSLVICLVLTASCWLARQPFVTLNDTDIQLGDYSHYRCQTGRDSGPVFRMLTLTSTEAMAMADRLCRAPTISRVFSAVEISWRPRGFLTARLIVDEAYDYFWNREHLVQGMVPDFHNYYRPLLDTPVYALYWLSLHSQPQLSREYFADKTVGFLQDAHSQTFFLQPFNALKEAGITLRESQKRFYPDINALYQAFASGAVDLISATPGIADELGITEYYSLLLADDVPSGRWFLRQRWFGSGVECDLLNLNGPDPFLVGPPTPVGEIPGCLPAS
ncbi:MAG: hypothetical protein VR73_02460 [Gammaproteobacteria bacterium BRH_c0]|nr:MAG: hypothetical protein VR73_02460 [Gammaproteobacteria bacterium BRH_c0]